MYVHGAICYWFFIPRDKYKTLLLMKVYRLSEVFLNRHIVLSFERSVLKEVCILCYLRNTNMPEFQNKSVAYYDC